jgi:hypothetical protein
MTHDQASNLCGALHDIGTDSDEPIHADLIKVLVTKGMVRFVGARIELTEKGEKVFRMVHGGTHEDYDIRKEFV